MYHTPAGNNRRENKMSETRVMREFEKLMYRDDFMFCRVMENPDLCRKVLECLLQRPIPDFNIVNTQKEIMHSPETKTIRLDVFNEDSDGSLYDTEMQNLNRKSTAYHQLPRRSRYYQGSIDIDYMKKGYSYKKLPESNVLFICTFDSIDTGIIGISNTNALNESGARESIESSKDAISKTSEIRSKIGAQQNRLEHTIANENNIVEDITAAEFRIRDIDMAKESANLAVQSILIQAGVAMMSQANQSTQGELQLLQ